MKAIGLFSGGLDSLLSVKVMQEQGIEIEALNLNILFHPRTPEVCVVSMAEKLGVPLKVIDAGQDLIDIVKRPRHGFGRNMNPCIDCRIMKFRKAREYMAESGASFIFTGEVLGERPMSQTMEAMKLIERESGLEGLVLRPLCAKLMEPTIPEIKGWVNREKLLDIQGRGRKPQIALARHYGITDYPSPAGGCKLTEPNFANRLRELMAHDPGFTINDVTLLMVGRHFRLSDKVKAVVGRDAQDNLRLVACATPDDLLIEMIDTPGPTTLIRGVDVESYLEKAGILTVSFAKSAGIGLVKTRVSDGAGRKSVDMYFKPDDKDGFRVMMLAQNA